MRASSSNTSSSGTTTVRHPDHPTGIYFHLIPELSSASTDWKDAQSPAEGQQTSTWAVSLLETPPSSSDAASIMGFVRTATSDGSGSGGPASGHVEGKDAGEATASPTDPVAFSHANPAAIQQNPAFFELLHKTLQTECVQSDELLRFEAQTRGSGWVHLNDQRELLMPGRQAWPENIIASVAFVDGELQEKSYQPNDAYRLVTAQDGFLQLKETWLEKVRRHCQEAN